MKNFKISFCLLLFLIGFQFQNCSDHFDCSFGPVPEFFDIAGIETATHLDTERDEVEENSMIDFEEYAGLMIFFKVDYISFQEEVPSNLGFSLMPSAYGCSPPVAGLEGSKEERLIDLNVITIYPFNENYGAQDTVNELFEIDASGFREEGYVNLEEYLSSDKDLISSEILKLKPKEQPMASKEFQVKVLVALSTGEAYEILSPTINFE